MSFVFVRHAQSQGNATGDYSTATHDSLSELGLRQAACLAGTLAKMQFTRVVASPLLRAMQTIKPYLLASGRQAEIWPELAEGCWQQRELANADDFPVEPLDIPPELAACFHFRDGKSVRPCGHETYAQGLYRARLVLDRLLREHSAEDILVVTHGHMLREMLNLVVQSPEPVRFPHDNCALTSITRDGDVWMIDYTNRPTWTERATA